MEFPVRGGGARGQSVLVNHIPNESTASGSHFHETYQQIVSLFDKHNEALRLDAALESAIASYAEKWVQHYQSKDINSLFVQLEGIESFDFNVETNNLPAHGIVPNHFYDEDSDDEDVQLNSEQPLILPPTNESVTSYVGGEPERGDITRLLELQPRAVLLGESGAGKTFCLHYQHFQWAKNYHVGSVLSIYLRLETFDGNLLGLCSSALFEREVPQGQKRILDLAGKGRLQLYLDGFNKCSRGNRGLLIKQITELTEDYPDIGIVLTGNVNDCDGIVFPQSVVYQLLPIDEMKQLVFIQTYLKNSHKTQLLNEKIRRLPSGFELASNPFRLQLIIENDKDNNNEDLPQSPAHLNFLFFDRWYKRVLNYVKQSNEHNATRAIIFDKHICLDALALLAYKAKYDAVDELNLHWAASVIEELDAGIECNLFINWISSVRLKIEQI